MGVKSTYIFYIGIGVAYTLKITQNLPIPIFVDLRAGGIFLHAYNLNLKSEKMWTLLCTGSGMFQEKHLLICDR